MEKFYKIGDVSKLCDISIKTLRYYEELNLIKPVHIDKFTGYRYYNEENIQDIYKIQMLKKLNFSLEEIKYFDIDSLQEKRAELEEELSLLKEKISLISYINKKLGGVTMKPFKNDPNAIGKWAYICSAINNDAYALGDTYIDNDVLIKELYFLPQGEGYWIFKSWTAGEIYHFQGQVYYYHIDGDKLFMNVVNEDGEDTILLVFSRVDNKSYSKDEISRKDNVNIPFIMDEEACGYWESVDFISIKDKYNYTPKTDNEERFLKSLAIMPNGDCFQEFTNGNIIKINWTKDYILRKESCLASNYIVRNIEGDNYLIMDWKSGDYIFGGEIYGCYVFKKVK